MTMTARAAACVLAAAGSMALASGSLAQRMMEPSCRPLEGSSRVLRKATIPAESSECYLPLDIMFLQDTTGSFVDDLPNVVDQIEILTESIQSVHPHSRFGVAEFRDKPYLPFGSDDDYCYRLAGQLSAYPTRIRDAYASLAAAGGGDLPEAQYQALIGAAKDPRVGWRDVAPMTREAQRDEVGARIIVLSTDAIAHQAMDSQEIVCAQWAGCPHMTPNTGGIATGEPHYECLRQDYPTPEQVQMALASETIHVIILTPPSDEVVNMWRWFSRTLLAQSEEMHQIVKDDSSDLAAAVMAALRHISSALCP